MTERAETLRLLNVTSAAPPAHNEWTAPEELEEYRLLKLLGKGSMGQVHLARDLLLDRLVAIKFVSIAPTPAARERFVVEARAVARLQHPNVVTIFRVGEFASRPYLVSEYVRGRSIDRIEKPMSGRRALEIGV